MKRSISRRLSIEVKANICYGSPMIEITGFIAPPGHGVASQNIANWQRAWFSQEFPDFLVEDLYPGTINVSLKDYVVDPSKMRVDRRTRPIPTGPDTTSSFEFVRIMFECPVGVERKHGWIYQPFGFHWHNLNKKSFVEIWTSYVPNLHEGRECRIYLLNNGVGASSSLDHISPSREGDNL